MTPGVDEPVLDDEPATERITFRIPPSLESAIESAIDDDENQSVFVRTALRREIRRRSE